MNHAPSTKSNLTANKGDAQEVAHLILGRRYLFEDRGRYEVIGRRKRTIKTNDTDSWSWTSYELRGIAEYNKSVSLYVAWSDYLNLSYADEVAPTERPERALPFAPYCGDVAVEECCSVQAASNTPVKRLRMRTKMKAWLDNGPRADQHRSIQEDSVIYLEEEVVEVWPDEHRTRLPTCFYVRMKPIGSKVQLI